ncbi:hypothetical protein J4N42_05325 [Vibrio sp. SCSIO 43135]|uniref:hypothetical protein n=1 Tax=Vibrio sp. SCSIO 43135 TaxID=2819096 RepID=UPI002074E15C|nr:hypothetical protein [Vibrio sp. SCSIO 43135]USD42143.1 hypothetical protein J4N42_05325 [Vibrio sp. SCSIO 43135]
MNNINNTYRQISQFVKSPIFSSIPENLDKKVLFLDYLFLLIELEKKGTLSIQSTTIIEQTVELITIVDNLATSSLSERCFTLETSILLRDILLNLHESIHTETPQNNDLKMYTVIDGLTYIYGDDAPQRPLCSKCLPLGNEVDLLPSNEDNYHDAYYYCPECGNDENRIISNIRQLSILG